MPLPLMDALSHLTLVPLSAKRRGIRAVASVRTAGASRIPLGWQPIGIREHVDCQVVTPSEVFALRQDALGRSSRMSDE